jgi:uncharacterized protein YrrD
MEAKMNAFDLHIGTKVRCLDGRCGKLAKIAVDPVTLQVTDLIVEEGFLLKQARAVPISTVAYAEPKDILLLLSSDDLRGYAEYRERVFERPATAQDGHSGSRTEEVSYPTFTTPYDPGMPVGTIKERIRQGISSKLEVISKGTLVKNSEGIVGRLSHLMTDPETGEITNLVVQQGFMFPEHLEVPVYFVESINEDSIFLILLDEELDRFWQQSEAHTP